MCIPEHIRTTREVIANNHIKGDGIEIGALHCPLSIPQDAKVKYVDRMEVSQLLIHYPELSEFKLVDVEIVDDGEQLHKIEDESQDFIIANHFLEHCENPVGTLKNHLKKLKSGGIIYIAVPDKTNSFDNLRPSTSIRHLMNDYYNGVEQSRWDHYLEWTELVNKVESQLIDIEAKKLLEMKYSIHFHVWTTPEFIEFIRYLKEEIKFNFEIVEIIENHVEVITVLRKIAVNTK